MMNPAAMLKALNKRRLFLDKHPEFYPFMKDVLENRMEEGTVMEITVTSPSTEEIKTLRLELDEDEIDFFKAIREII